MKKVISILLVITTLFYVSCYSQKKDKTGEEQKQISTTKSLIQLNFNNFEKVTGSGIALVSFWSENCKSWNEITPILEELAKEIPEVTFASLNIENNKKIINDLRLRIRNDVPTFIVFVDGEPVDGLVDVQTKEIIKGKILTAKKNKETMDAFNSGKISFMEAYDFTLPDLNGNEVTLSKIGGLIILDFWATWCSPCKNEIPYLQQFYDEYKEKGLTVIGVSSEAPETIKKFKKELDIKGTKISYIILVDQKRETSSKFSIRSIPTTYFIGPDGNLIKKETGFTPQYAESFKKIIEENLPKQK